MKGLLPHILPPAPQPGIYLNVCNKSWMRPIECERSEVWKPFLSRTKSAMLRHKIAISQMFVDFFMLVNTLLIRLCGGGYKIHASSSNSGHLYPSNVKKTATGRTTRESGASSPSARPAAGFAWTGGGRASTAPRPSAKQDVHARRWLVRVLQPQKDGSSTWTSHRTNSLRVSVRIRSAPRAAHKLLRGESFRT